MRTCLRRSLATGLVFRRQLPLAPRCYAFLPGCGQGLALATTARPAPLRSALLLRRKLRRYLVSLRNCWPRQQPTPGSDAAQRVSPDFSPEVPVPSRRLRTGFRPFTCSLPAGYPTAPRPARGRGGLQLVLLIGARRGAFLLLRSTGRRSASRHRGRRAGGPQLGFLLGLL